jgi:undecaprenyl-diphosphatase
MPLLQALVLRIEQGLSEFLPISSSGHLILTPVLFGWSDQGLIFDTVLHLGTLCAVVWFFRHDLVRLFSAARQSTPDGKKARTFLLKIAVATVPGLAVGLAFQSLLEHYVRNANLIAFNLAFWGIILFIADRWSGKQDKHVLSPEDVSWKAAILIGCAQALALVPGTSRSGITITAGLFLGLHRTAAARFSFLLCIPITAAAGGYGLVKTVSAGPSASEALPLFVGFAAALLAGMFAIRFLLAFVARYRYDLFVVYRLALALGVLVLV